MEFARSLFRSVWFWLESTEYAANFDVHTGKRKAGEDLGRNAKSRVNQTWEWATYCGGDSNTFLVSGWPEGNKNAEAFSEFRLDYWNIVSEKNSRETLALCEKRPQGVSISFNFLLNWGSILIARRREWMPSRNAILCPKPEFESRVSASWYWSQALAGSLLPLRQPSNLEEKRKEKERPIYTKNLKGLGGVAKLLLFCMASFVMLMSFINSSC